MMSMTDDERASGERFREVAKTLLQDAAFIEALDSLSIEVLDLCETMLMRNLVVIDAAGFEAEHQVTLLIPLLCGWILGFHDDLHETQEARLLRIHRAVMVAATAAGFSCGHTNAFHQSQTQ